MKLRWSRHAFDDRMAIFDYIQTDNPRTAMAIDDRILRIVHGARRWPDDEDA